MRSKNSGILLIPIKPEKLSLNRLDTLLPGRTPIDILNKEKMESFINEINQDPQKVIPFLSIRLHKLKTSGQVISMDPLNAVDMNHVVSATSATIGAPESLHSQFHVNHELNGQIRANMALRLCRRSLKSAEVIQYDPENPGKMISDTKNKYPLNALIDGAGAFKDSSKQAAELLRKSNPSLGQVGYHEGEEIRYVGKATGDLKKTGFFFNQSHTRGTDIGLSPNTIALMPLSQKDGIRKYFQKEGRLRLDTQRYILAVSKYEKDITSIPDEIAKSIRNDALDDAQDIYRKCKQEIDAIVRKAARNKLLACETIDSFMELFEMPGMSDLFISPAGPSYQQDGDYFNNHQHLRREDQLPKDALTQYKANKSALASQLHLQEAVDNLDKIHYSDTLIAKMPPTVAPVHEQELEMELEVETEEEQELELEQQLEVQLEMETEAQQSAAGIGSYPIRMQTDVTHSLATSSNKTYDGKIELSDSFIPLSRLGTASTRQRRLFDANMYRVGIVFVHSKDHYSNEIKNVVIEDPLEDSSKFSTKRKSTSGFFYDVRNNQMVTEKEYGDSSETLRSPEFKRLIAQVKFFDGRTSGYSEEELNLLKEWLRDKAPAMREHLLNDILKYRYSDKQLFAGSQLDRLFTSLMP